MGRSHGQDLDPLHRRLERERLHSGRQDRRQRGRDLRIAFLDSWQRDPAKGSGTTVSITTLARALQDVGHEVRILGDRDTGGGGTGHADPRDARTESGGPGSLGSREGSASLWERIRYNRGLHDLVLEADPDLAVGFDVDGFLLPRRRPYPLVLHLKGVAADEARFERGLSRWKLRLLALLERRNARRADRVVVPSHYSANHAIRAYGLPETKVSVVPEAVDPSPWEHLRSDPPPRQDRAPTILTVGRQYPRKNTRTLIGAFSRVTQHVPDAVLRIVGDGPELPRLRQQAVSSGLEDRVEFLGALPRMEEIRREYLRSDCFCLPTLQEGFGIVFLEAMSAGLPVVAGRAGAVPEVVSDGKTGLLVNPRDPAAVADALVAVLTDRGLAERLGAAGLERAARFTPDRTATEFLEVARGAIRAHTSSAASISQTG